MTGLYPLGTTCASKSGQVYTSSYDAFGNVTTRSFSGTTATLSYDILDHFTEWNAGATNQEWYVSDASGQRVLRRSTNSTSTTITVYAFGVEEHTYSGSGTIQANKYYYTLAGRHLGVLSGGTTYFQLTDALGSIVATISTTASSAAVQGNQVFGPYGKAPYQKGSMYTAKGFTGQYNDSLTGLDYYNARYYDPKVGVFLSADVKQGNLQGLNPYAYVGGNPETKNDPTGLAGCLPGEFCLIGGKPGTLQGCDMDSCSGPPPPHLVFPDLVIPDLVLASSSSGKAPSGSGGSAQATNSVTSCGLSGPSQPLCGNYWVNFAVYLSTGGEIGLPGFWCFFCGEPGGGSDVSGETGGFRDLTSDFASDTGDTSETQSKLMDQALDIREELGLTSNTWLRRNLAFLRYLIGEEIGELVGVSGRGSAEGTVASPSPITRLFTTFRVGGYPRAFDAEVKLLEFLGSKYKENTGVQGIINLFSERQPCRSCEGVIEQFQNKFPNIKLYIEWYQDNPEQ